MIKKAVVVVETTDKTINTIDTNATIETSELAALLNTHLNETDIDRLIGSIESLGTNEKEYLLKQIK